MLPGQEELCAWLSSLRASFQDFGVVVEQDNMSISILIGVRGQGGLVGTSTPPSRPLGPAEGFRIWAKIQVSKKQHSGDFGSPKGSILGSHVDSK